MSIGLLPASLGLWHHRLNLFVTTSEPSMLIPTIIDGTDGVDSAICRSADDMAVVSQESLWAAIHTSRLRT